MTFVAVAQNNPKKIVKEPEQTVVNIQKPAMMWLWAGAGFHNSEASMLRVMSDEFRDQVVLKAFREISPTITRVFAGYYDWTKTSMHDFADYYDLTFRQAGTTVYMVPGRMPFLQNPEDDKCIDEYMEQVCSRLEYIIKERKLTKVRYYCLSNEMCMGNQWGYFDTRLDLFKKYNEKLYWTLKKHNLDIGLAATDTSGFRNMPQIDWATKNMDQITDIYCWHVYLRSEEFLKNKKVSDKPLAEQWLTRCVGMASPGELEMYDALYNAYKKLVVQAMSREKRLMVGEYGYTGIHYRTVMSNDMSYECDYPEYAHLGAITRVEMALAALNAGCHSIINWTMFDYPEPFLREDGDSPMEKAWYDVARFSGHSPTLAVRHNKNGVIRWEDSQNKNLSYPSLYAMGYFVKFFKKNAKVMPSETNDPTTRVGAIVNPDNSSTIVIINWGKNKTVKINSQHNFDKPLRYYLYDSANVPYNKFCDLQKYSKLVEPKDGSLSVEVPARSIVYLTTDYQDRIPSEIKGIKIKNNLLKWNATTDKEHCYYRVFKNGEQIASTVATSLKIKDKKAKYSVKSVDKWGNCSDKN
jgi:hypothetical protein